MPDVYIDLDDDGDVVRVTPGVVQAHPGHIVTYYLSTKDGTDWQFDGYHDPANVIMRGETAPTRGRNGEPGMSLTLSMNVISGTQASITLLYSLTLRGVMALPGKSLPDPLVYRKSNDPIIVFR